MSVRAYLDQNVAPGEDRRHARLHLRLPTSGVLPSGETANVLIHNASVSGMLLETGLALLQGDSLTINLPEAGPATARVVWANDRFYGCEFDTPVSPAVLAAAQLRSDAALPENVGLVQPSFRPAAEGFGKRLEQLRKGRRLTLADVARELGVSKPTVWAWEKGKARPLEDRLPAIAAALGVDAAELADGSSNGVAKDVIDASRENIARVFGLSPAKVRIMVEL